MHACCLIGPLCCGGTATVCQLERVNGARSPRFFPPTACFCVLCCCCPSVSFALLRCSPLRPFVARSLVSQSLFSASASSRHRFPSLISLAVALSPRIPCTAAFLPLSSPFLSVGPMGGTCGTLNTHESAGQWRREMADLGATPVAHWAHGRPHVAPLCLFTSLLFSSVVTTWTDKDILHGPSSCFCYNPCTNRSVAADTAHCMRLLRVARWRSKRASQACKLA